VGLSDVFALQISSAINLARSFGTPRAQGVSLKAASLSSRPLFGGDGEGKSEVRPESSCRNFFISGATGDY